LIIALELNRILSGVEIFLLIFFVIMSPVAERSVALSEVECVEASSDMAKLGSLFLNERV